MDKAHVREYIDVNYKGGHIVCACGWRHELGDGFNVYNIDNCPSCTPELQVRHQRKVTTGNPRKKNLTVSLGDHVYFVLDGEHGIHVQYSKNAYRTVTGLSERQAEKL